MYSHSVSQGKLVDLKDSPPEWYRIGILPESVGGAPQIFLDLHFEIIAAIRRGDYAYGRVDSARGYITSVSSTVRGLAQSFHKHSRFSGIGFGSVFQQVDALCEDGFVRFLCNLTPHNVSACVHAVATLHALVPLLGSADSRAIIGITSERRQLIQLEVTATRSGHHQICAVLGMDLVRYVIQEEDEAKLYLRLFRAKNSMVDLWSVIEPNSMPANLIANSRVMGLKGGGVYFRLGASIDLSPPEDLHDILPGEATPVVLRSLQIKRPIEVLSLVAGLASLCDVYRESLK